MTIQQRHRVEVSEMQLLVSSERSMDHGVDLLPAGGIFRILICRVTHSLGNTLLLTPLIRELEATYPGAEIDIVTRAEVAEEILGSFASVRTIYRLPAHGVGHPLRFLNVLRGFRRTRYDLVIDPCPRSRTGRLMLLLAKGRFKLGFLGRHGRGILTHGVTVPTFPKHTAQRPVFLLQSALGRAHSLADYPPLSIALSDDERAQGRATVERLLARMPSTRGGKKGVIGIFANATGPKLLPEEWWRVFMEVFAARHVEYSIIEIVPMFGRALLDARYAAFYSSDIRRLASVLSALSAFISADCGVLHLACASGTPVVGIFSVTDPEEWGPYGARDCVLDAQGLSPAQVAERICIPPHT